MLLLLWKPLFTIDDLEAVLSAAEVREAVVVVRVVVDNEVPLKHYCDANFLSRGQFVCVGRRSSLSPDEVDE